MQPETDNLDLLWGCKAIAAFLGVTERACFHMLEQGVLPARQVGQRWVASRKALRRHFEGQAA